MINIDKYKTDGKWTYNGFLEFIGDNWTKYWGYSQILDLMERNPDIRCYFFEELYNNGLDNGYFIPPYLEFTGREKMFNENVYLTINNITILLGERWDCEILDEDKPYYLFNSLNGTNYNIYRKLIEGDFKLTSNWEEIEKFREYGLI